jgi:indole-3-glycerol phosphate synthase
MLKKIIDHKRTEIEESKNSLPLSEIKEKLKGNLENPRDFKRALTDNQKDVRVIAEIKKASPSKGVIRSDFNPVEIAKVYDEHGASAISVLTDKKFFMGDLKYINNVKQIVNLPILRKDFIIDPYQIYETRLNGGDAVLLIVSLLDDQELKDFYSLSCEMGMECLVEVHDDRETERALKSDCSIIGINNRDLKTFKTDIKTTLRLIEMIPDEKIVVSESGIEKSEDIKLLKDAGVDAFLIGEAFMKEKNIANKFNEVINIL